MNGLACNRVELREHDGAGAAAPLSAAHLGSGQTDAVQVLHQEDGRIRIRDNYLGTVEPECQLIRIVQSFRHRLRPLDLSDLAHAFIRKKADVAEHHCVIRHVGLPVNGLPLWLGGPSATPLDACD